jgi:hypothetical protein
MRIFVACPLSYLRTGTDKRNNVMCRKSSQLDMAHGETTELMNEILGWVHSMKNIRWFHWTRANNPPDQQFQWLGHHDVSKDQFAVSLSTTREQAMQKTCYLQMQTRSLYFSLRIKHFVVYASARLVAIFSTKYFYVSNCPATCSIDTYSVLREISCFNNNNKLTTVSYPYYGINKCEPTEPFLALNRTS